MKFYSILFIPLHLRYFTNKKSEDGGPSPLGEFFMKLLLTFTFYTLALSTAHTLPSNDTST